MWRGWVLGIALALAVAGMTDYIVHEAALAKAVADQVPALELSYREHHWDRLDQELSGLSTTIDRLRRTTGWLTHIQFVPMVGSVYRRDAKVLSAMELAAIAARDLRPLFAHADSHPTISNLLRRLSAPGALQAARAINAMAHLPRFPHGSAFAPLNQLSVQLGPFDSVAALMIRHPGFLDALLGADTHERFLVIFQDSGELRATGGFMAAYGFLTVHHGRVRMQFRSNISKLSQEVRFRPPAPWVLRTYFHQTRIPFINANLNPNVPSSAQLIERMYQSVPQHLPINGVIFADSWLAERLIGALGSVSDGGVHFTGTNFYQTAQYLAEDRGLPNSTRMTFLGDILQTVEKRIGHSTATFSQSLPVLAAAVKEKHLMVYANNPALERWIKDHGWSGTIPPLRGQNSLMVVNSNYGGLKDNYFMTSQVSLALTRTRAGQYQETVTTSWSLSGVRNGWLVGTYVGWVQCWMPKGARLVRLVGYHTHGVKTTVEPSIDRTLFGTGILIAPRTTAAQTPNVRTLKWVFLLPPLSHPDRVHIVIQPGLSGQELVYSTLAHQVTTMQRRNEVVVLQ